MALEEVSLRLGIALLLVVGIMTIPFFLESRG